MSGHDDLIDARWFSKGQQLIQQHVGTRQHAHAAAAHGIFSEYIPKQQQYWLANQPIVYASTRNPITQQVWVTPLYAHLDMSSNSNSLFHPILSFLKSDDKGSLVCIDAQSRAQYDPFDTYAIPSAHLALVFVDLSTRDRFRMNGKIEKLESGKIYLRIKHSFSFCPKYVKRRAVDVEHMIQSITHNMKNSATLTTTTTTPSIHDIESLLDTQSTPFQPHLFPIQENETSFSLAHLSRAAAHHDCILPPSLVSWIISSHDMFVGSSDPNHNNEVGYKGGTPGFIRVLDQRIIIYPDYMGNPFFTVLGNSITYPQMSLCFIDHHTGHTLQLTGIVSLQYRDHGMDLDGADRHVIFRVTEWRVHSGNRPGFYPILWRDLDSSSHNYVLHDIPVVSLLHEYVKSEFISRGMNEQEMEDKFDTRLKREMNQPIIPTTITTSNTTTSTIYHGTSQESPCMMRVTAIISEDHPMNPSDNSSTHPSILTYELEIYFVDTTYTHLQYTPGQYATFNIILPNGNKIRRSWTISKPIKRLPIILQEDESTRLQKDMIYTRTRFCISVKRVEGGRVTPWMHEHMGVGSKLQLIGIEGQFVLPTTTPSTHLNIPTSLSSPSSSSPTSLMFFTAGVGITPAIAFLSAIHDLRCRAATSTGGQGNGGEGEGGRGEGGGSSSSSSSSSSSASISPWLTTPITLFHSERSIPNIPFTPTLYSLLTHQLNDMKPVLSHLHLNITGSKSTTSITSTTSTTTPETSPSTPTSTSPSISTLDTTHLDPGFMKSMNTSHISMTHSRITLDTIMSHITSHPIEHTHAYICGPPPFQQHIISLLEYVGIAPQHIHMEQFDY